MKGFDRIAIDPAVMNGQPCIKGTRLTVKRVLLALAQATDREDLRKDYPQLGEEAIQQVLAYAAANLDDETIELRTAS
jgi:uncharacterized protein (DUF433 family)